MAETIRAQPTEDGYAHNPGRARGEGEIAAGRQYKSDVPFWFRWENRVFPARRSHSR